jgi:hypothetical protein
VIDNTKYVDFTVDENNAGTFKKEDILFYLNGTYRNADSYLKIQRIDGSIEMSTGQAVYEGRGNTQFYAKYIFEVLAANNDEPPVRPHGRGAS